MTAKEAMKIVQANALPANEVDLMMHSALSSKRTWKDMKIRLAKNFKGDIGWSTRIFRTVPFVAFLRLLVDHTCLFTRPEGWEDPYENFWLRHLFVAADGQTVSFARIAEGFYAQCWSTNPDSAALWKTATKDPKSSLAVRIESTVEKYCHALCSGIQPQYRAQIEEHLYVGKVNYKPQSFFDEKLREKLSSDEEEKLISTSILQDTAVKTLLLKRAAFSFEEEVRFIIDVKDFSHEKFFVGCDFSENQKVQLVRTHRNIKDFVLGVEINPWCEKHEAEVLRKVITHLFPQCEVKQSSLLEMDSRILASKAMS